jgi:RsiW-degrading membrane proteinase PrsW (M82 family)
MEQGSPPPPPELQEKVRGDGFHLPGTNFFKGFRQQIAAYEQSPSFNEGLEPLLAGIGAFVLSALFTLFISLGQVSVFSPIFSGDNRWIGSIFLAPPVEEVVKGLSVVAVALFIPRAVPNRRYAVAFGAAAGLGYALSEDITYFANPQAQPVNIMLRLIMNPIGHPVYSALCAVGIFLFVSKLRSGAKISKAISGLPILTLVFAILFHSFWNAWQFFVNSVLGYLGIVLSIFVLVVPCLVILRDFLGGHFNFGHFFESIPEPPPSMPTDLLVPPPPTQNLSEQKTGLGGKLNLYFKSKILGHKGECRL